ncbi:ABC transporter substrate-binding protein [Nocardiopsis composta]|uniref:Iron complex transport system substrate-binding protein n=1 Tax=Nocardiopsis composta TaxID=157465 RepID=A0A7W8VG94_9ACTN|nr:ABC transporter substrate-binding protein [Nocardiopsis composta]MBB5434769.1 iron complex transport system substrate-binding protein [Nocardiopsis composta]
MRIGIPKNACNEARKVRLAYHLPGRAGRGLLAAGCSSGAAEAPADGGETRTVEHIYGESEVPAEPERVVAVSVTSTPVLLSLDLPVVAAGTTGPSALTDDKGFFAQWAETADERGVEALPGPEPDVIVGNGFGADAVDEATYDKLSEIAPTVVYGESDTPWLELTEEVAGAFGAEDRAAEIAKEYEDLTAEAAGQLEDAGEIAAMTGTPEKFFVFTPESAQGRFFADLGLTQHEFAEGEAKATEGRADTVEVSLEKASAFGEASLLFVNTGGEEIEDYAKMAPNLEKTPAFEEDRAFTLGPAAFRLDYYSVPVVADRLVEVLG